MCLVKNKILPYRATKDIVCWKGLNVIGMYDGKRYLITPYTHNTIKKIPCTIYSGYPAIFGIFTNEIEATGVHAYTDLRYAGWFKVIAKCIIPKGALYYMDSKDIEIAASKIKIVSIDKGNEYINDLVKNKYLRIKK